MHHHDLPKSMGIYKIYFLDPNLFYIGSAVNLRRRYQSHLRDLCNGRHVNRHLQNAFALYGSETLHFEVIEHIEHRPDLHIREQFYLNHFQPHYNISQEATHPYPTPMSPEAKVRHSERMKGNTYAKGKPAHNKGQSMRPESKAKLSASLKGRVSPQKGKKLPPERVEQMVALHKGKPSWNKGISMREESRRKMIEAKTGKPNPHAGNPNPRNFTPESLAARNAKIRATRATKTPEQLAEAVEKRRATMASKKTLKQAKQQMLLWDDLSTS